MSSTACASISSPYSRWSDWSIWIARRMSPSDCVISSARTASDVPTPSSRATCASRPTIASPGSGLKRNLAQRDAIGGMIREM